MDVLVVETIGPLVGERVGQDLNVSSRVDEDIVATEISCITAFAALAAARIVGYESGLSHTACLQ